MSNQTFFKRAALVVVASLGLGFLSGPSSQAMNGTIVTQSLTLGAATATATTGDTATGTWTTRWTTTDASKGDSITVTYGCEAPAGATCPSIYVRQTQTADTANILVGAAAANSTDGGATPANATWNNIDSGAGWTETSTAGANVSARSAVSYKATGFSKAGTYIYTFYLLGKGNSATINTALTGTSTTWTVTVTNPNTAGASLARTYFAPTDAQAAYGRYSNMSQATGVPGASIDSSIVVAAGTTASPALAAVLYAVPANSAGDTSVLVGSTRVPVQDTLTVSITGAGTVSTNSGTTKASSATMNITSSSYVGYTGESVSVYSNGTSGTATLTLTNAAGTVVYTKTLVFTGTAASAGTSLSDTYTYIGASGVTFNAQVKDAGGNVLTAGTFYVFSSDTKIVSTGASLYANGADQYQTAGRCSATWNTTTKTLACPLTISDTGTASIYFADSWNVTASSFVTTALTLTVSSNVISTATVAFDKATYAPGERAVITITAKDIAGRLIASHVTAGSTVGTASRIDQTPTLSISSTTPYVGTNSGSTTSTLGFTSYQDTGVETRVVTMPTYGTDVTYTMTFATDGRLDGSSSKTFAVTATAKVIDPSQAAQNTAIANAQAAADAATDAALQAIDAANAATDAANLAAEAADAATVAAQESKDSADAATAAVESLATQVATLMAALQAQITSLANVVAKIAKKVKA